MRESTEPAPGEIVFFYVGRTLVHADFGGPFAFFRDGKEVECVCDPETGIECTHHYAESMGHVLAGPEKALEAS